MTTTLLSRPPPLGPEETPVPGSPMLVGHSEERLPWSRVGVVALAVVVTTLTVAPIAWWLGSRSALVVREAESDTAPRTAAAPATQARGIERLEMPGAMASDLSPAPSAPTAEPKPPSAAKQPAPLARKPKARIKPKRSGVLEVPSPADGDECIGLRAEAEQAAASAVWGKVVKLTLRPECWSSRAEHERLRVRALFESQAWSDCVEEGRESSEPRVQRWVELCQRHVD